MERENADSRFAVDPQRGPQVRGQGRVGEMISKLNHENGESLELL